MTNCNINKHHHKVYSNLHKVIGWVEGNALCKNTYASKHMLKRPFGWSWDLSVLERARRENIKSTIIYEQEKELVYQAKLSDFWRFGIRINRGFGEQICLPQRHWQITRPGEVVEQQLELPM